MGNLEKPLTLGLAILFIVGLIIMNCECGEGKACSINGSFNINTYGVNTDTDCKVKEDVLEFEASDLEASEAAEGDTMNVAPEDGQDHEHNHEDGHDHDHNHEDGHNHDHTH